MINTFSIFSQIIIPIVIPIIVSMLWNYLYWFSIKPIYDIKQEIVYCYMINIEILFDVKQSYDEKDFENCNIFFKLASKLFSISEIVLPKPNRNKIVESGKELLNIYHKIKTNMGCECLDIPIYNDHTINESLHNIAEYLKLDFGDIYSK